MILARVSKPSNRPKQRYIARPRNCGIIGLLLGKVINNMKPKTKTLNSVVQLLNGSQVEKCFERGILEGLIFQSNLDCDSILIKDGWERGFNGVARRNCRCECFYKQFNGEWFQVFTYDKPEIRIRSAKTPSAFELPINLTCEYCEHEFIVGHWELVDGSVQCPHCKDFFKI